MDKVKRTPAKLPELVKEFNMEVLNQAPNYATQTVTISDVNRPALQLVGFYEYFEPIRLQILGKAEMVFLQAMGAEKRRSVLEDLLRCEIPALIVARSMEVFRSSSSWHRSTAAPCCARTGKRWTPPARSSTI